MGLEMVFNPEILIIYVAYLGKQLEIIRLVARVRDLIRMYLTE